MVARIQHLWPAEPDSRASEPFYTHRDAAIALLGGDHDLTRKAGQFLGQLAVDPTPLSEAQSTWLINLLRRHGLPALESESLS